MRVFCRGTGERCAGNDVVTCESADQIVPTEAVAGELVRLQVRRSRVADEERKDNDL